MTKILVVDDNEQNQYMLKVLLEGNGYEMTVARNGIEALETARKNMPDLIISDILMPGMDGFALCRHWMTDDQLKHIPFIFYTATYTDPKDEEFALNLGAERFIRKPTEPQKFIEILRDVLKNFEAGKLTVHPQPIEEEKVYFQKYNKSLIRKLEEKMLELEQTNKRLSALFHTSISLTSLKPLEELITEIFHEVLVVLNCSYGYYFNYDENKKEFHLQVAESAKGKELAKTSKKLIFHLGEERGFVGLVGQTQKPLTINDTIKDSRWTNTDKSIRSAMYLSIGDENQLEGVLCFLSNNVGNFDNNISRDIFTMANNLSVAIKKTRLFHKIEQSEIRYRTIVENSVDAIITLDTNRLITAWSKGAENIFGHSKDEQIGQTIDALVPTKKKKEIVNLLKEVNEKGYVRNVELQYLTKAGKLIDVEMAITFLSLEKSYIAILRDITMRKQAEKTLMDSEEKFKLLFQYAPDGYYILDTSGNIIDGNLAADKISGYPHEEMIGSNILKSNLLAKNQVALATKLLLRNATGHSTGPDEFILNRKDGKTIPVEITTYPVNIKGEKRVLGIGRDISLRKKAEAEHQDDLLKLRQAMEGTIRTLAITTEVRDPYTAGHQKRVSDLAYAIANEFQLSNDKMEGIKMAGLIHDIGKIQVPAEILSKPGKLSAIEFSLIKMHSQIGFDILKTIEYPWPIAQIVFQHHERLDGSGYPQGLHGDKIIIEARILAVADVVEAMSSHRPYRPALGIEKALEEISKKKGTLYDPGVVRACINVFEKGFKFE